MEVEVVFRQGESRPSLSPDRSSAFSIRCFFFHGLATMTFKKYIIRHKFTTDVLPFMVVSVQQ